MSFDLPGAGGDFAKGVSGTGPVYDTSPAGLGLSPAYLASASASASSSNTTSGTIFPTSPANGDVFIYTADATNGVKWPFQYDSSQTTYKWVAIGPTPLYSLVATSETTASATYAALATAGPSIILPCGGDYYVTIGGTLSLNVAGSGAFMSYDIGGTGAVDGDAFAPSQSSGGNGAGTPGSFTQRKNGLTVVTLTAKYRAGGGGTMTASKRWMSVSPIRVSG